MARPAPSSVLLDGTPFYLAQLTAQPDVGQSVLGPGSAQDDDFPGASLNAKWTTTGGGSTTVSGGDARTVTSGVVDTLFGAVWPGSFYQSITGNFDARLRTWARTSTDAADLSTIVVPSGQGGGGALVVAAAATLPADLVGMFCGYVSTISPTIRFQRFQRTAGVLSGNTTAGVTHPTATRGDLRIVRNGQLFELYVRDYNAANNLASPSGWQLWTTIDRTASPLPNTVQVHAATTRSGGSMPQILARQEEFILMPRATLPTEVGTRVAVSDWSAAGTDASNDAIVIAALGQSVVPGWGLYDAASGGNLIANGLYLPNASGRSVRIAVGGLFVDGVQNYAIASANTAEYESGPGSLLDLEAVERKAGAIRTEWSEFTSPATMLFGPENIGERWRLVLLGLIYTAQTTSTAKGSVEIHGSTLTDTTLVYRTTRLGTDSVTNNQPAGAMPLPAGARGRVVVPDNATPYSVQVTYAIVRA